MCTKPSESGEVVKCPQVYDLAYLHIHFRLFSVLPFFFANICFFCSLYCPWAILQIPEHKAVNQIT